MARLVRLPRRFLKKGGEWYLTYAGLAIITLIFAIFLLAPIIAPYDPIKTDVGERFTAPNFQFPMGTDLHGRDVYSRIIYGARTVMLVALASTIISLIAGVPIGLASGYAGGKADRVLSLVMDSIYSFPGLILAIALAAMLGPGVVNMSISIAVVYIPTYFRMIRGQVLSVKENLYIEAARAVGAKARTIVFNYIFPNVIPSILVLMSLNIADAILTEAGLSFLGLGISAPTADWGFDLQSGRPYFPGLPGRGSYWWLITFPGLMIIVTVLGFSLFGEGLNEILNPRQREGE